MANENEVKNIIERTKSVFLPKEFRDPDGKPSLYSLDDEFRKARKNHSWKFYFRIFVFLCLVVGVSVLITAVVKERGKNQKVDISSFQDLKLKELIEASQKQEGALDIARRELAAIEMEMNDIIESIRSDYDQRKELAISKDSTEEEKKAEIADLESDMNGKIDAVKASYAEKINRKKTQIELIKKDLAANKGELSKDDANKMTSIIAGDTKLQTMQENSIKSLYEARIARMTRQNKQQTEDLIKKYNPNFSEKELQQILSETVRSSLSVNALSSSDDVVLLEKAATPERIASIKKNVADTYKINARMGRVPYINSAGRAIIHISARFKDVVAGYDAIVENLAAAIRKKNSQIKYYDYAFNFVIKDEKECGYILDPRDGANVGIFLNRVHDIKTGDLGYVFRQDDEYIGSIRFKKQGGIMVAETVSLEQGAGMQPFDRIMLNKIEKKP